VKSGHWDFSGEVQRRREDMIKLHTAFPFWKECHGRRVYINDIDGIEVWYGPEDQPNYVRLIGSPNTLAYDVIRHRKDIPFYGCNLEIVGDVVHQDIDFKPFVDDALIDPDDEDCQKKINVLPIVHFDPSEHFAKRPTYNQEIDNLVKCRGSPHIVQLLGRTEKTSRLVFEKHPHDLLVAATLNRGKDKVLNIKKWMLQIIDGVAFMHSLGLIHRDLIARNILIGKSAAIDNHPASDTFATNPVVLCDLQCRHASLKAPEVCRNGAFTPASDIYCLGYVLWQLCYYNNPIDRFVLHDFPPPAPFDTVFKECMKDDPSQRPTLEKLKVMLVDLGVDGYN
jgi:serine/threonine protein kinase